MANKPGASEGKHDADNTKYQERNTLPALEAGDGRQIAETSKSKRRQPSKSEQKTSKLWAIFRWIRGHNPTDQATAFFTFVIAASTIAYTVYARRQWKVMSGQLAAMNNQVIEMKGRPYVGVNVIKVRHYYQDSQGLHNSETPIPKATFMGISLEIKNFGLVPGTNYVANWRVVAGDTEYPTSKIPSKASVIFPGESMFLAGQIGPPQYKPVMTGDQTLRAEVTIEYDGPSGDHYKQCEKHQFAPSYNAFLDLGEC